ncbi:S41 family peptidase [Bdellovibrio bacteriovorus]
MKRISAIVFATFCAYVGYKFTLHQSFVNPYPVVCDIVAEKIYLDDNDILPWKRTCLSRSHLVTPFSPKKLILKDINNVLDILNVSHLEVFDSSEVKTIWKGESLETGIESEFVDSELVIFKVHKDSPAEKLGIKMGDVIKTINGEQPNPWEAQSQSGEFVLERKGQALNLNLKAADIKRTEKLELQKIGAKHAQIKIPSFRAEFFKGSEWSDIQKELSKTERLVVDVRGNIGGNFVAGLRFLSFILCESQEVGRLIHPRAKSDKIEELPNELSDDKQLAVLDRSKEVLLKTFPQDECYKGKIEVLVDGKTSSVAELVAQALKEFKKARILGAPSKGQLLVGVWYPLDEVAPGVEISIPEALYVSHGNHRIEGNGVQLDKVLYYHLPEMQAGVDSWVKQALD